MLFVGIVEVIALFSSGLVIKILPRKFGTILCTVVSSVLGFMFLF
jgi:hypothetical protein